MDLEVGLIGMNSTHKIIFVQIISGAAPYGITQL